MQPIGYKISIEIIDDGFKTESGIYLPTNKLSNTHPTAKVLAIGKSVTKVKEGDEITFERDSEYRFEHEDMKYVFIMERSVHAIN